MRDREPLAFDAIFAASDVTAIPQDVAVVGFDDIPAASLSSPPLSTVTQDARGAGEALVEALIEAIEAGAAKSRLLPVRLTVRESECGANVRFRPKARI